MRLKHAIAALLCAAAAPVFAQTYKIDSSHTYPSFEADHMGISFWRGKFNKTRGSVTLDRAAKTGTIDIVIDASSIDFGHDKMNEHARAKDMFNVEQYPSITYKGNSIKFEGDAPAVVEGELTLLGTTKPVSLKIGKFKCITHPFFKREVCGADAQATFNRSDFGLNYALPRFAPEVKLAIQVEAIRED
jgi:polyisoprenoid-binding protein YceI